MTRKIIVLDLDGTLLEYDTFKGNDVFGQPIEGAAEAVKKLRDVGYIVLLYTCRMKTPKLMQYLADNGFVFDGVNDTKYNPPNTSTKPTGDVYVDDRAIQFKGNWDETLREIADKLKVGSNLTLSVDIPKVPISSDIELWKKAYYETREILKPEVEDEAFFKEVLKRFKDMGGLELGINANRPPEEIKDIISTKDMPPEFSRVLTEDFWRLV